MGLEEVQTGIEACNEMMGLIIRTGSPLGMSGYKKDHLYGKMGKSRDL